MGFRTDSWNTLQAVLRRRHHFLSAPPPSAVSSAVSQQALGQVRHWFGLSGVSLSCYMPWKQSTFTWVLTRLRACGHWESSRVDGPHLDHYDHHDALH